MRKIDRLLAELYQILELRSKLRLDAQEQFDLRIEPVRLQIQAAVNALKTICTETNVNNQNGNIYNDLYEQSTASNEVS